MRIDDVAAAAHINVTVDGGAALQDGLLLLRDLIKLETDGIIHKNHPKTERFLQTV